MLGFILSKINMLILVVAVFSIVAFFTFSLIDIVKVYEGRLLLDQISSKSFALMSSPSYCFSDSFDLPRSIPVGGQEFFYVIKISTQEVLVKGENVTIVIFSLFKRGDYLKFKEDPSIGEPPSVAASAFRTKARVKLFSRAYFGENYGSRDSTSEPPADEYYIIVDPSTEKPFNTIEFRKEVDAGSVFGYIFPCSGYLENCEAIKRDVACVALAENSAVPLIPGQNCENDGDLVVNFQC